MENNPVFLFIVLCSCAILGLCMPATSAAAPDSGGQPNALVTTAELNVTNVSLANVTIPARYLATPTPIWIGISSNDTALDGPKGEMAAVPRTIGFSVSPVTLAIVIVVIAAGGISAWQLMKRRRDKVKKE
jgi:lysozyme family protein